MIINKSRLFKRAWQIKKSAAEKNITFGKALAMSWEIEKKEAKAAAETEAAAKKVQAAEAKEAAKKARELKDFEVEKNRADKEILSMLTGKPKKGKTYRQYLKERKEKDLKFFYGEDVRKVSNKYFEFKRVIDNDNIIIITNNIRVIKDSYVLVVGEKKAVYLKDWQVRRVSNYYEDLEAYAVKLNRKYFKTYNFKNEIDQDLYFEKDNNFDDLLELAKIQDERNISITEK